MELKQVITRLNQLYHQSKVAPLSEAELKERDQLRQVYLSAIRGQVIATLERIEIVDQDTEINTGHSSTCSCCKH
ncbi:MAG TPA: DUF896 domain-containing protein [Bacillota bacterium]|jgi:uncharacterized protein YnzC (UPF0291/DUF896 family)|nr:DUF896 domain-containing protein [Bacillota bacterium]HOL08877.1 DUF896 domain-containing protein [Bacillota bacterium]HPO96570.1 DUF896 domain-containing protein [Bacillota bacterium]